MFSFFNKNKKQQKEKNNILHISIENNSRTEETNDKNATDGFLNSVNNYKMPEPVEDIYVDSKLEEAIKYVCEVRQASTSMLQRRLNIGYARAGRMIDDMEQLGVIGAHRGSQPREVLITYSDWLESQCRNMAENKIEIDTYDSIKQSIEDFYAKKTNEYIKNRLNIEVDYSNNGYYLSELSNVIVPNSTDKIQNVFINNLIRFADADTVKLILINETPSYNEYKGIAHLLLPIINEHQKSIDGINWLLQEMNDRLKLFSEFDCKDIESYNKQIEQNQEYMKENQAYENEVGEIIQPVLEVNGLNVRKEKLPHLVLVINEFYYLNENVDVNNDLIRLLLNSRISGIHIVLFSKFSVKNLSIEKMEDLLKIVGEKELKGIFYSQQQKKIDISNNLDGYKFESLCGELLKNEGFTNIKVTKSSNDFGADVIAEKDDVKYAIQCKRYSNSVGVTAVQEVIASKSIYKCHVAVVMTNSTFTKSAIELATENGVLLWDGEKLSNMLDNYNK